MKYNAEFEQGHIAHGCMKFMYKCNIFLCIWEVLGAGGGGAKM